MYFGGKMNTNITNVQLIEQSKTIGLYYGQTIDHNLSYVHALQFNSATEEDTYMAMTRSVTFVNILVIMHHY